MKSSTTKSKHRESCCDGIFRFLSTRGRHALATSLVYILYIRTRSIKHFYEKCFQICRAFFTRKLHLMLKATSPIGKSCRFLSMFQIRYGKGIVGDFTSPRGSRNIFLFFVRNKNNWNWAQDEWRKRLSNLLCLMSVLVWTFFRFEWLYRSIHSLEGVCACVCLTMNEIKAIFRHFANDFPVWRSMMEIFGKTFFLKSNVPKRNFQFNCCSKWLSWEDERATSRRSSKGFSVFEGKCKEESRTDK